MAGRFCRGGWSTEADKSHGAVNHDWRYGDIDELGERAAWNEHVANAKGAGEPSAVGSGKAAGLIGASVAGEEPTVPQIAESDTWWVAHSHSYDWVDGSFDQGKKDDEQGC